MNLAFYKTIIFAGFLMFLWVPLNSVAQLCSTETFSISATDAKRCVAPSGTPIRHRPAAVGPIDVNVNCSVNGLPQNFLAGEKQDLGSSKDKEKLYCEEQKVTSSLISALPTLLWVVLAFFAMLFYGKDALKRIDSFKGGGFEVKFNSASADLVKTSVKSTVGDFIKAAHQAYSREAVSFAVREHLEGAVDCALKRMNVSPQHYRCTIHVPDVVYSDYLYQLVDYYPAGGGSGRRFSKRRGIIGRAWRLNQSHGVGNVIDNDPPPQNSPKPPGDSNRTLIEEWSMTREEVLGWNNQPKKSFLCIVLRVPFLSDQSAINTLSEGRKVGIFYMDSKDIDAFGNDNDAFELAIKLEGTEQIRGLAQAVDLVMKEMRKAPTDLNIENV